MSISEPFDGAPKPKLQLQVIRGGAGGGGKTAIAACEHHRPEDYEWPLVAGWFHPIAWWHIVYWRNAFQIKTPTEISEIMHAARVPLPSRLLTYWRWKLWSVETIDRSNLHNVEDFLRRTKFYSNGLDEAEVTTVWLLSQKIFLTPTSWHLKSDHSSRLRSLIP